jgi:hypothetical protein
MVSLAMKCKKLINITKVIYTNGREICRKIHVKGFESDSQLILGYFVHQLFWAGKHERSNRYE